MILQAQVKFNEALKKLGEELNVSISSKEDNGPGWTNPSDRLRAMFAKLAPDWKVLSAPGLLESGAIFRRYPWLEMFALGPWMEDVHTNMERLNLPSTGRTIHLLDKALIAAGELPPLSSTKASGSCSGDLVPRSRAL